MVPLRPVRNIPAVAIVKVILANRGSDAFHVHTHDFAIRKFAMLHPCPPSDGEKPQGKVTLHVPHRQQRVATWLETVL